MIGLGTETVGTDAGAAHSFDPAFPCHAFLMGNDKYGLTQLQNVARLPATGRPPWWPGPLPIVSGSGETRPACSPSSSGMRVDEAVGRALVALGVEQAFGVVGSGNFHVTNALVHAGGRFVAARHEGGAATMTDAYSRMSGTVAALSVHQGCRCSPTP